MKNCIKFQFSFESSTFFRSKKEDFMGKTDLRFALNIVRSPQNEKSVCITVQTVQSDILINDFSPNKLQNFSALQKELLK
jgi:hypothetical protein